MGLHWGAIKFLYDMPLRLLNCQANTTPKQPKDGARRAGPGRAAWVGLRGVEWAEWG